MTYHTIYTDPTNIRSDYNQVRPDPAVKLAYYRCVARRPREGKETRVRLRD